MEIEKNKNSEPPKWSIIISTFFGAGKLRPAPGTWGTLAALPFVWAAAQGGVLFYMAVVIVLIPVSIVAAHAYESARGGHDYSEIVIDEVVGIFITMTWLPMNLTTFFVGFFLFRFLDIFKPFPIRYLDRNVQGGLGVVIDDLVAGLVANIILQVVYTQTTWLGVQAMTIPALHQ